ncbi:tRNA-guanine transglycosylase DpdA [Nonomuraea sp. NPDC049758]|uniref:tRNA-guanine transglycosylase DpdA n=1 Tax=Nonomuraea sp. NPDC049758 TaxID=3154360 RepID=UPI00341C3200
MKFFFPDSQDQISPSYDFVNEEYSAYRVRQRDDTYAHEVLAPAPYDGILVSKAIIDGSARGAGKYSERQRERLYWEGVKEYFRLPAHLEALGDCGAFTYADQEEPPYTVSQVLDFYERCQFDSGISLDHVIFGYDAAVSDEQVNRAWVQRREMSLRYAEDFLEHVHSRGQVIEPIGAAQGWSPASYADSVMRLQSVGYSRIALGGMVPLRTDDILECLIEIDKVREPKTHLHLLGITRMGFMETFGNYGVSSFDSTSPFRQAFMDDKNNYYTTTDRYTAIRVPQVDGNPKLKKLILAGSVSQQAARSGERESLRRLRSYDQGLETLDRVIEVLEEYEQLVDPPVLKKDRRTGKITSTSKIPSYRRTLEAKPWQSCMCAVCTRYGVEVIIFRGSERNKGRGFHNLAVFADMIHHIK